MRGIPLRISVPLRVRAPNGFTRKMAGRWSATTDEASYCLTRTFDRTGSESLLLTRTLYHAHCPKGCPKRSAEHRGLYDASGWAPDNLAELQGECEHGHADQQGEKRIPGVPD